MLCASFCATAGLGPHNPVHTQPTRRACMYMCVQPRRNTHQYTKANATYWNMYVRKKTPMKRPLCQCRDMGCDSTCHYGKRTCCESMRCHQHHWWRCHILWQEAHAGVRAPRSAGCHSLCLPPIFCLPKSCTRQLAAVHGVHVIGQAEKLCTLACAMPCACCESCPASVNPALTMVGSAACGMDCEQR